MPAWRLTAKAEADLQSVFRRSWIEYGERKAVEYVSGIEKRFELLALQPELGRRIDRVRKGYRRFEYGRHVIFYRRQAEGIEIVRILHDRMDFPRRL